jgi:2,3-dihydroxybenzoate decarboxylase
VSSAESGPSSCRLIDSILEIGADRILFSVDWPFENVDHASDWFNSASISENDRFKIGRRNAIDLFKLNLGETTVAGHGIHQAAE